jgi:hypothetical protein
MGICTRLDNQMNSLLSQILERYSYVCGYALEPLKLQDYSMKKHLVGIGLLASLTGYGQNVGIGIGLPTETLHVDSILKIGKNTSLNRTLHPTRVNALRFGDGAFVSIGEDTRDDQMSIRMGTLLINKSPNAVGTGFVGINVDSATAQLDVLGSVRLRTAGTPGVGKVLTSDANGVATWQSSGNKYLNVPFTAFKTDNFNSYNDLRYDLGAGLSVFMANGSFGTLFAPIVLPANSTLTKLTVFYTDNSTVDLRFDIRFLNVQTGNPVSGFALSQFSSSGQSVDARSSSGTASYSTGSQSRPMYITVRPSTGGWPVVGGSDVSTLRVHYAVVEYEEN